jgi:hypothetical protein
MPPSPARVVLHARAAGGRCGEIGLTVATACAEGAGVGAVIDESGFRAPADGATPRPSSSGEFQMEMLQRSRRLSFWLTIVAVSLGLLVSPLLAKGTLDIVAKFEQANLELDVATFVEAEGKAGLLGLRAGTERNSFAFGPAEWAKLTALVAKAARAQSTAGNWTVVGTMTETETSDISHLVVSAGPGIRFALSSPKKASLTYVLATGDIPRLQQGLARVKEFLAVH